MKQTEKSLIPYYKKINIKGFEKWREYTFPGSEVVRILKPEFLIVSDNGHRLGCGKISHYVPYGWIDLKWENEDGHQENFFCESSTEEQAKRTEK